MAYANIAPHCSFWQGPPTPYPCFYISCWWMSVFEAVPSEGSEIMDVQLRLAPWPFIHWNSSWFLEWFNDIMKCRRTTQIHTNLSRGALFSNVFMIFSLIWWQSRAPLLVFAPQRLSLSWIFLLYHITCWQQVWLNIIFYFYLFAGTKITHITF